MVLPIDSHLDFGGVAQLRNVLLENVATTAGLTAAGQIDYVLADNHIYGHNGTAAKQIPWADDNGIFGALTADPATPAAGKTWYNTTTNTLKYRDGATVKTIATTDQLTSMFRTRATAFSAAAGNLPVAADATTLAGSALQQGDVFLIGTGGTIVGIGGSDVLETGDMLVLFDAANPTVAASWTAFQVNVSIPTTVVAFENVTVALVAGTAATVTPTVLKGIQNVSMYDNNNLKRPFMNIVLVPGAATASVTSLNAVTGARAYCEGTV